MQGPLPPGIFGYRDGAGGINPYVYQWQAGHPQRLGMDRARALLAQAGYPNGRDAVNGKPLVLYFDAMASGPDAKSRLHDWMRKQFDKLGVQLVIRSTDYNRFQDKMRNGTGADLPVGLERRLPGPGEFPVPALRPQRQGQARRRERHQLRQPGVRRALRAHARAAQRPGAPATDRPHGRVAAPRRALGGRLASAAGGAGPRLDANQKPNDMATNTLKYLRLNPSLRAQMRAAWNPPHWAPVVASACWSCWLRCRRCACGGGAWAPAPWATSAKTHDRLHAPPPALRDSDPDRRQPADLRAVFRGQLPGRHGGLQLGNKYVTAEAIQAGSKRTATTCRCSSRRRRTAGALTDTIFYTKSVRLFAS